MSAVLKPLSQDEIDEVSTFLKKREDNGDAYGFTEEMANDICKRISSGESIKRIALHDGIPRDYYSIIDDNEDRQVGELLVAKDYDSDEEEIDIAMFIKHERIAEKIISQYIVSYAKATKITAVIRNSNSNFNYIKSMLESLGFVQLNRYPNTTEYAYYRK